MYFISNIFLRIRGGSKSSCTNAIFFALVQELIDRPSYINEQLLEHDAYISCLQLKKVNVAHDAMHNNYLYNHTAYYHVLQQVIAFLVMFNSIFSENIITWHRKFIYRHVRPWRSTAVAMTWRQSNITSTNHDVYLFATSLDYVFHAGKCLYRQMKTVAR